MKTTIGLTALVIIPLLQGCAGSLPRMHEAARDGDVDRLRVLIASGESPNQKTKWGDTPLHWAAIYGKPQAVKELLDKGANPNSRYDKFGTTPLWTCDAAVMKELINRGANVRAKDKSGRTPLHEAVGCDSNQAKLVELLVAAGAGPNEADKFGTAPLHIAASHAEEGALTLLLKNGADVNATNAQDLTPSDIAVLLGKDSAKSILDSYGGRSKRYSSKTTAKATVVKGSYFGNTGLNFLNERFAVEPGFVSFTYTVEWVGKPGYEENPAMGAFIYRGFLGLKTSFFAEPNHTYIVDTHAVGEPTDTYGIVKDETTGKAVGYCL